MSAPDSSSVGSARNASRTLSVWSDMRTSRLTIVVSLHRVVSSGKPIFYVKGGLARFRRPGTPPASAALRERLACSGRRVAESQVVSARPARPLTDDEIGIVALAGTTVVARERLAHVVVLVAEIEAQDGAAHVNVGCDVYQLVAAHAEPLGPERHHLHQPDGARGRDRPAVEAALHRNQCHHES